MVFSVSLIRESKKLDDRYKTLYVEADNFSEVEGKVIDKMDEDEGFEGFHISSISRESESNFLV